jgi:hypothetical protein
MSKREDKYTEPKVGTGLDCLRTPEAERASFALGYYIGRRFWTIDYPLDEAEQKIKDADQLAYWCGYDLGSYHSRQNVGLSNRQLKEFFEKSCQTASERA